MENNSLSMDNVKDSFYSESNASSQCLLENTTEVENPKKSKESISKKFNRIYKNFSIITEKIEKKSSSLKEEIENVDSSLKRTSRKIGEKVEKINNRINGLVDKFYFQISERVSRKEFKKLESRILKLEERVYELEQAEGYTFSR